MIDVRSLVPLDTQTILGSVAKTHRLFTVEENPRLCGWGAEIVSIVADEAFYDLDGPPVRITTPHIPLPAADILEDIALPNVDRIVERVRRAIGGQSRKAACTTKSCLYENCKSDRPVDRRQMAQASDNSAST